MNENRETADIACGKGGDILEAVSEKPPLCIAAEPKAPWPHTTAQRQLQRLLV